MILSPRGLKDIYNPDVVVRAFARVREAVPDAQLVLKHSGVDELLKPGWRDAPGVKVVGHVEADEMVDLFRAAEVTVSIPRSDSSPRSVWEAMAAGSATVLSDLPWAHELIEDGRHALLVTPAEEAVAAAIERLLADPRPSSLDHCRGASPRRAPARPQRRARSHRGLLSGPRRNVRRRSHCALCGGGLKPLFDKDGYAICRCGSCGLVQVDAAPSRDELERIYGEEYFSSEVFHDYVAEREVRVRPAELPFRRLPDWFQLESCWTSVARPASSSRQPRRSYEATGVELSPFASSYARDTLGLRVFTGDVSDGVLDGERFDVVTAWNTIEHMADPLGAFTMIARIMRPGGLLALSTGDVTGPLARFDLRNWNLMVPPYHLFLLLAEDDRLAPGEGRLRSASRRLRRRRRHARAARFGGADG